MSRPLALLTLAAAAAFAAAPLFVNPFTGDGGVQAMPPIPQDDAPVGPAPYAFAIWGPIYLWLVVSAVFGLVRRAEDADWDRVRGPLLASMAAGAPWLWVATQTILGAAALLWTMTGFAIWALLRTPARDAWWLRGAVGLYAGWVTAASFVILGLVGAGYGIGPGPVGWAGIAILGALAVALGVIARVPGAPTYAAAVIWALVGIIVTNLGGEPSVAVLAAVGAAIVAWRAFGTRRRVAGRA